MYTCTDSSFLSVAYHSLNWVIIGLDNDSSPFRTKTLSKAMKTSYLSHPKQHIPIKKLETIVANISLKFIVCIFVRQFVQGKLD